MAVDNNDVVFQSRCTLDVKGFILEANKINVLFLVASDTNVAVREKRHLH